MNAINPVGQAKAEARHYGIEFPTLICRETGIVRDYKISKLPHLIIIDHEGIVRSSELFLPEDAIKSILDDLIAKLPQAETAPVDAATPPAGE